jgi:hypothetical protein
MSSHETSRREERLERNRDLIQPELHPARQDEAHHQVAAVERQFRNVIDTFSPAGCHERLVHVANVLHHLPYGRELMHLGLQTMAHRHGIPEKYRPDITDPWWDRLDGTLPEPAFFADLPDGTVGLGGTGCTVEASDANPGTSGVH